MKMYLKMLAMEHSLSKHVTYFYITANMVSKLAKSFMWQLLKFLMNPYILCAITYFFWGECYKAPLPLASLFSLTELWRRQDRYLFVCSFWKWEKTQRGWVFWGHTAGQSWSMTSNLTRTFCKFVRKHLISLLSKTDLLRVVGKRKKLPSRPQLSYYLPEKGWGLTPAGLWLQPQTLPMSPWV